MKSEPPVVGGGGGAAPFMIETESRITSLELMNSIVIRGVGSNVILVKPYSSRRAADHAGCETNEASPCPPPPETTYVVPEALKAPDEVMRFDLSYSCSCPPR